MARKRARPEVVRTVAALRDAVGRLRAGGAPIALVPTMGALHDGHLSLVEIGHRGGGRAVVSIFVNPTQFAAHEDLGRYPRDESGDLDKLATVGTELVYAPTPEVMYPDGFATRVVPAGAAEGLESDFRPHFFAGVATVCCKLFTQCEPDIAVFGEKDFQQLAVVRQLVRDLDLRLEIVGAPTAREPDGLAMSSRNRYLSAEERRIAPTIHRTLEALAREVAAGDAVGAATARARAAMTAAGFRVDYVEVRDAETLRAFDGCVGAPGRALAAAWLGKTRLIDNIAVPPPPGTRRS